MIGKDALTEVPKTASPLEVIVFSGILRANLSFKPTSIYSTPAADNWPTPKTSEFSLELRDDKGKTLNREAIAATTPVCGSSGERLINGRIALREGSRRLMFFRGDILVTEFSIASRPPELTIKFDSAKASREPRLELQVTYSQPDNLAFMQLLYEWTPGRYRTLAVGEPVRTFNLDLSSLPDGNRCRLIVAYTSGLRTSIARTETFSLKR